MQRKSRGYRLRDGQEIEAAWYAFPPLAILTIVGLVILMAWCPSHDSFEAYLAAAAAHPSAWLSGLSNLAEKLRIAVAAETKSYIIFRTGTFRGRKFVGACGTWFGLPAIPTSTVLQMPSLATSVCQTDGAAPHEQLALLFIFGFAAFQFAPRVCMRHGICSLEAVQSGRLWTAVTANLIHANPAHLLHNMLQVLHLAPIVQSAIGCEKALLLLLGCMLGASAASVLWHGILGGKRHAGSVGGSGVAMGLVAANGALFPRVKVIMYGFELNAASVPLVYLLFDVLSSAGQRGGDIDISAHAGGAVTGWLLATRWKPWWLLS